MRTKKALNGTDFEQLKDDLTDLNKVAVDAQSEQRTADALVSNNTEDTEQSAEPTAGASEGAAKKKKSKKVYQTGINTTIDNSRKVNKALDTFGPAYVSPIPELELPVLVAMYIEVVRLEKDLMEVSKKQSLYLNNRGAYYKTLNTLGAQIVSMLKACGADKVTLKNARKCVKKMQGLRIIPIDPKKVDDKHISAAHTQFVSKLAMFGELIEIAANFAGYAVVTGTLGEVALRAHYAAIDSANDIVLTSAAEVNASRRLRNAYFNTETTGLVDTYQRVKANVKALYGTVSAEYKAIAGLTFTRIRE